MDANATKIARKFNLTAADVAALAKVGLDTPTKIKAAKPDELPEGLRDKLTRWQKEPEK